MLTKYNHHLPLKKGFVENIEDFFNFYWENDKNAFLLDATDKKLNAELPIDVRVKIMKNFLFQEFFVAFDKYFEMSKPS